MLKGGLPEWVNSAFECVDLVFCGSGRKGNLYNVGTASRSRSVWVPTDMARAYGSESIGFQAAVEHKPAICGVRLHLLNSPHLLHLLNSPHLSNTEIVRAPIP